MRPEDVNPGNFEQKEIIYDDGDFAIAKGIYNKDGVIRFAMRWNGDKKRKQGYPNYGKWPMWFQLPDDLGPILAALLANSDTVKPKSD